MALFRRKKNKNQVPAQGEKQGQLAVLKDAFKLVRKHKPVAIVYSAVAVVVVLVGGILIGSSLHHPVYFAIISLPLGVLLAFFIFTRQANGAAFASIENQLGAAGSVIMAIRSGFTVTPAVAVNKNQDMVHRAIGRCGVVLVGEGGFAVRAMMQEEHRKVERFIHGVPVTEVYAGNEKGQVPLRKLQKHLKKLPKKINKAQLREVRSREKAIGGMNMPMPKGPMAFNRNARMPKR
jgi:F0F1-type ATP synthase assembly protein I